MPRVGALALQGDFREHLAVVTALGAEGVEVRTPEELATVDCLIIPGGESTAIGRLATRYAMIEPLRQRIRAGMPVLGTCAGMIFLAAATTGKVQPQLGVLDVTVERNAFGRQQESFEANLDVKGFDRPMPAIFIRAPWIDKVGADVDVMASVFDPSSGREFPVFVRSGNVLAISFHPELTNDARVHELLLSLVDSDNDEER
jgi:pyridoxal 5'-phosphate synthase pdxT subunit